MKYKFKEAFAIWLSCHTVKGRRMTRLELIMFSWAFFLVIPMIILIWWIPVTRIMKKGVKRKRDYEYFNKRRNLNRGHSDE